MQETVQRGARVAIDLYLITFQMRAVSLKEVINTSSLQRHLLDLKEDKERKLEELVVGRVNEVATKKLYSRIVQLIEWEWSPVFCIDSVDSHPLRARVHSRRSVDSKKRRDKIGELEGELVELDPFLATQLIQELIKLLQQDVSNGLFPLIQTLASNLATIGFPVIYPEMIFEGNFPSDGEAVGAALSQLGLIDFVYTNDADAHTFGCKVCITALEGDWVTVRETSDILSKISEKFGTSISLLHFQVACILAGVDYNDNIRGIAFGKAMKLVAQVSSKMSEDDFLFHLRLLQLLLLLKKEIPPEVFEGNESFDWNWFQYNAPMTKEEGSKFQEKLCLSTPLLNSQEVTPYTLLGYVINYIESLRGNGKENGIYSLLELLSSDCINWHLVFPLFQYSLKERKVLEEELVPGKDLFLENGLETLQLEGCSNYFPILRDKYFLRD